MVTGEGTEGTGEIADNLLRTGGPDKCSSFEWENCNWKDIFWKGRGFFLKMKAFCLKQKTFFKWEKLFFKRKMFQFSKGNYFNGKHTFVKAKPPPIWTFSTVLNLAPIRGYPRIFRSLPHQLAAQWTKAVFRVVKRQILILDLLLEFLIFLQMVFCNLFTERLSKKWPELFLISYPIFEKKNLQI